MKPLTLGIVPYLNVLPLLEGLDATFPRENWIHATPRELAGLLAAGEVDIAIVSTFEGLRRADRYRLIPGVMIGSDGAVRSVALYSKVPIARVRTVVLDFASLTSVNLVRILLDELYDLSPDYIDSDGPVSADFAWKENPADAFLVIGDVALQWENDFPYKLDLGGAWKELTGLPFVFAAWWVREGVKLDVVQIDAFQQARITGTRRIDEIVARLDAETLRMHGGPRNIAGYLRDAIHFEMGGCELVGLLLFRQKLLSAGLLPGDSPKPRLVEA